KLLGLEESRRRAELLVSEAKAALEPWQASAAPLLALADYITSRDR
ncbi:MAG: polyprenyl synthetase family protein, partial [Cyanobacteriota bacterium]|nr:polyprenyl synthetase family protein [Cyanobacteriota bacterium]